MKRRSFQLSQESFWKLESIRSLQEDDNLSQTLRFCIDFAYEAICLNSGTEPSDKLTTLVEKNNVILRFILIELVKTHDGQLQPLSDSSRQYLKELKQQMQNYLEKQP
jgi:hypothetical protein